MVHRDGSIAMLFLYCYGSKGMNGVCMERNQPGVRSDRTIKMISLYLIYTHALTSQLDEQGVNEVSNNTFSIVKPYSSPLVRLLHHLLAILRQA